MKTMLWLIGPALATIASHWVGLFMLVSLTDGVMFTLLFSAMMNFAFFAFMVFSVTCITRKSFSLGLEAATYSAIYPPLAFALMLGKDDFGDIGLARWNVYARWVGGGVFYLFLFYYMIPNHGFTLPALLALAMLITQVVFARFFWLKEPRTESLA